MPGQIIVAATPFASIKTDSIPTSSIYTTATPLGSITVGSYLV